MVEAIFTSVSGNNELGERKWRSRDGVGLGQSFLVIAGEAQAFCQNLGEPCLSHPTVHEGQAFDFGYKFWRYFPGPYNLASPGE
jgi:hypothetical protein